MLKFIDGEEKVRESNSDNTIDILIAGDFYPGDKKVTEQIIREHGVKIILRDIGNFIKQSDISVIQLETPLTTQETPIPKSGPNLKAPPECIKFLTDGGFDIALLANNHIGDFGPKAVIDTMDILKKNNIKFVGAGRNLQEALTPLVMEKKGFRIGIINIAEHEFGIAGENKAGSAPQCPLDDIKRIKKLSTTTDIIIVVIHGGNEHNPIPSPRMVANCRAYVEAGANAVINIHTHCPQGIEIFDNAVIIYSPGNFFFPSPFSVVNFNPENFWRTGFLPKIKFDKKGVVSVKIEPFNVVPDPWRILPLRDKSRDGFFLYLSEISNILLSDKEIKKFFDGWCVMQGDSLLSLVRDGSKLWPADVKNSEMVNKLLPLRNCFSCEAHNELLTNFLRLLEEYRIDEVKKIIPEIKKLQKPYFYQ